MSSKSRNFWVGITVLAAVGVFGWMILQFGAKGAGIFAVPQSSVEIDAPRVDGLSEGSALTYQGVVVGRITRLQRNDSGNGVTISALLQTKPPVPTNVDAKIVITNLLGGGTSVALELKKNPGDGTDQPPEMPAPGAPYPPLHAVYVGLNLNILPAEYGDVASQISRGAQSLVAISDQIRQYNLVKNFNDTVLNINSQVTHAGEVLKSIQDVLGDPSVQQDLRVTIANTRKASEQLAAFGDGLPKLSDQASGVMTHADDAILKTQARVDELSKKLADSAARLSALLDDLHSVSEKINNGQGTAGLLVNDPKLYQASVDSIRELNANLLDLQRLLEQWEQEGLSMNLKLK